MTANIQPRLERFRSDYGQVRGQPFDHFYCPILFTDEDVPLCKAHIINRAFRSSSRAWTIQRKDVDNFYGSMFEADFTTLQYTENGFPDDILANEALSKRLGLKLLADNKQVDYFFISPSKSSKHGKQENFTMVNYENGERIVPLGIKIPPAQFPDEAGKQWEIEIFKDVRISALVTLVKSAHLTLFEMVGYRYALSSGGYFVGRNILGEFFLQNNNKSKPEIQKQSQTFFREYIHMVRPIQSYNPNLKGTITDKSLLVCKGNGNFYWAVIVFVRTSKSLHAVMVPILEQVDAVSTFLSFLHNTNEFIETYSCRYEHRQWRISTEVTTIFWPKSGVLYP